MFLICFRPDGVGSPNQGAAKGIAEPEFAWVGNRLAAVGRRAWAGGASAVCRPRGMRRTTARRLNYQSVTVAVRLTSDAARATLSASIAAAMSRRTRSSITLFMESSSSKVLLMAPASATACMLLPPRA